MDRAILWMRRASEGWLENRLSKKRTLVVTIKGASQFFRFVPACWVFVALSLVRVNREMFNIRKFQAVERSGMMFQYRVLAKNLGIDSCVLFNDGQIGYYDDDSAIALRFKGRPFQRKGHGRQGFAAASRNRKGQYTLLEGCSAKTIGKDFASRYIDNAIVCVELMDKCEKSLQTAFSIQRFLHNWSACRVQPIRVDEAAK